MKVVVHPGFHKTGTTSIQRLLEHNRDALVGHCRLLTPRDLRSTGLAALAYCLNPGPDELGFFIYELAKELEAIDPNDTRTLIMSSEDLAGQIPGRHGLTSYAAAPQLMSAIEATVIECLPKADVHFYFSIRRSEQWVESCYAQHVRSIRLTEDKEAYIKRMLPYADLPAEVARIQNTVKSKVHSGFLIKSQHTEFGPATPLLDLLDLPNTVRNTLDPVHPANAALPDEVLSELLSLNRSEMENPALKEQKRKVIRDWKRTNGIT